MASTKNNSYSTAKPSVKKIKRNEDKPVYITAAATQSKVQEPVELYLASHEYTGLKSLGAGLLETFFKNKLKASESIESGLPYKEFKKIYDIGLFTEDFWADVLGISLRSLHRYKQLKTKFKPLQAEKIIAMAEVINIGTKVFGSNEKFSLWLETPNFVFGGKKPAALLKNSYGKELVLTELTQIDQGIFA